ncbi:MAG: LexA family transcriptional regulator [Planctomycetota bacterium]
MKKFDYSGVIKRIRQVREEFAGKRGKSQFARSLCISPSTYNYYENNRLAPIPVLLRIHELTGCDLKWLLTGVASIEPTVRRDSTGGGSSGPIGQTNTWVKRKLDELLVENPESARAVEAFITLLLEKKEVEKVSAKSSAVPIVAASSTRGGLIPVLGRTAAGMVHFWAESRLPESKQAVVDLDELVEKYVGRAVVDSAQGAVSVDLQRLELVKGLGDCQVSLVQVDGRESEGIVEFVQSDEISRRFPDGFALQIDGDSMSPRINDGDVVILSASVPACQGQIAVARLAGQIGVTCKLIRTTEEEVHLIPINEKYDTKIVPKDQLLWALAVLCHVKK